MSNHKKPILEWLDEHNARELAAVKGPQNSRIHFFTTTTGRMFIVHFYDDGGWEVYVPIDKSHEVTPTLYALDAYAKEIPS